MTEQWRELKETIIELRDNDGTATQQEVCKFLANMMDVLEKQMNCSEFPNSSDTIYRQAAIDIVRCECCELKGLAKRIIRQFNGLPPVQPYTEAEIQKMQELEQVELEKAFELGKAEANKWIPCDKGEPDEGTECWVTVKTTDALYRGTFTKRYGERRDKGFVTRDGFMWWNTALAWMPIYEPEPYRTEGSTEENK